MLQKKLRHHGSSMKISGGTRWPFISGKVLYAKPARMPATNPPESAITKTSAATPIAQARTDRCGAERQRGAARMHEREPDPEHRREDREREAEMRGEPELRHARIVDEPALHHVPAHRALQAAQHEDAEELPRIARRNVAAREEPEQRHEEDDADQAPEQPVEVLPPEDALELGERHALVHLLVLGRQLVLLERLLPLGLGQRRQRADDRLPLDDRQARMREARDAADDDHREHQRAAHEQPRRDPAACFPARGCRGERCLGGHGVHSATAGRRAAKRAA